jgi:hypothetical protein
MDPLGGVEHAPFKKKRCVLISEELDSTRIVSVEDNITPITVQLEVDSKENTVKMKKLIKRSQSPRRVHLLLLRKTLVVPEFTLW